MALGVVGHGRRLAGLHRKARLSAIQRLYLGLLVDGQDDRVLRRVHGEADDVDEFVGEGGILGALEGPDGARGARSQAFQIRWTVRRLRFIAFAMARPVQCVASEGGG